MRHRQQFCALSLIVATAVALPVFAQAPGAPTDLPPLPERTQPPVSRSDKDRVVGKVLEVDREAGRVKLESDEGVVVLKPSRQMLNAIRVGDTVSVPRSPDEAPSASPRTR